MSSTWSKARPPCSAARAASSPAFVPREAGDLQVRAVRAARAWVSVMPPPPMKPTRSATAGPLYSGYSATKAFQAASARIGGEGPGEDQQAVAEHRVLSRGRGRSPAPPGPRRRPSDRGVRGEEPVPPGVPVGRVAGVVGVVEDQHDHVFVVDPPRQRHPAGAGAPDRAALQALAAVVDPVHALVVQGGDGGGRAAGVGEDLGLVRGRLEGPRHAEAEDPLLVVREAGPRSPPAGATSVVIRSMLRVSFVRRRRRSRVISSRTVLPSGITQSAATSRVPSLGAASRRCSMARWWMVPIFAASSGRQGLGVVPEVDAVHVAVVEPEADVVGVVHPLPGPRVEGEPARDQGAARGADGEEHRLGQPLGPDVGGEGLRRRH